MARKRGGLAGLYDRNKGKFRTAGTLIGTGLGALVGGPAGAKIGGTLAGAAFRGFDRPGKSGIGFDVSQGLQGAAEGYGTAALASGAYGGIKNLFSPNISGAMNRASGMIGQANQQIAANPAFGGMAGGAGAAGAAGTAGAAGAAGAAGKAAFAKSLLAPQVLGSAIQGGLSMLPSAQSEALNAQTRLAQQQFDEEKRRTQMEEERKRRIAEMLMPFMQKNFPQYVSGGR